MGGGAGGKGFVSSSVWVKKHKLLKLKGFRKPDATALARPKSGFGHCGSSQVLGTAEQDRFRALQSKSGFGHCGASVRFQELRSKSGFWALRSKC